MLSRQVTGGLLWFCMGSVCLMAVARPVRAQHTSGAWTAISPLPIPASSYTLTVLQTGEILITGGWNGGGISNRAFLYNSSSHSFRPVAQMKLSRASHAATLLPDGSVLITGGWTPNSSTSAVDCSNPPAPPYFFQVVTNCAELYDADTQTFRLVGSMNDARSWHTATFVDQTLTGPQPVLNFPPAQRVIVAGGEDINNNPLDSIEYYNLTTQKFFRDNGKLVKARYGHTATWLPNVEKILIAGGGQSGNGAGANPNLDTAEIYDSTFDRIMATPKMTTNRLGHTATLLKDGTVLLAGGDDEFVPQNISTAEIFDPVSQTFAGTPGNIHISMINHSATLMGDGSVMVAGGEGTGTQNSVSANVQIFNTRSGFFFAAPAMLTARKNFTLVTTPPSNEVLAVGGAFYVSGLSEGSINAAEIFALRKIIAVNSCITRPIACQLIPRLSPPVLFGMVHDAMVISRLPAPPEETVRDRKGPITYKITISGLSDHWDAGVVTEDGMPLKTERSDTKAGLTLTMVFKDEKALAAARENGLLVFQMTSKAAPGKEYPITMKAEVAARPASVAGSQKP